MKIQITIILTYFLILIFYSSEISFMPNYVYKFDKWHLIIPMLFFFLVQTIILVWSIVIMIKQRKFNLRLFLIQGLGLLLFAELNNPKGYSQVIGYCGFCILLITSLILYFSNIRRTLSK